MEIILQEVKNKIDSIIEIADKCPDKYQVKCFEILLNALMDGYIGSSQFTTVTTPNISQVSSSTEKDFFLQYEITRDEWQKVYHYDGTTYSIIVRNLKVKDKANKQKRLASLLGVMNLLNTNEASISKKSLAQLCKQYAAHDLANFSAYMKKSPDLFLKQSNGWLLTEPGKEFAAQIIKEIAK